MLLPVEGSSTFSRVRGHHRAVSGVIAFDDRPASGGFYHSKREYTMNTPNLRQARRYAVQRLQQELKRQKATLRKKNQELKRQEKMRDELSRLLIHDLKAPL